MMYLDENFDGKLSYAELRAHIDSLGFDMAELEERDDKWPTINNYDLGNEAEVEH